MPDKSEKAPGPWGTPIGGNLWAFWRNVFDLFEKGHKNYGDIVRFRVTNKIFHLIVHPKDIHRVLMAKDAPYSRRPTHSTQVLLSVVGDSLLTLEGKDWQMHRKLAGPAFSPKSIQGYISAIESAVDQLNDRWLIEAQNNSAINVQSAMTSLTALIAGRTFFGTGAKWDEARLEESIDGILDHHWQRIKSLFDLVHKFPTKSRRRFDDSIAYVNEIVSQILKDNDDSQQTLLTRLLSAREDGKGFSEEDIRNEIVTFLLAGHETTATLMIWCFYNLAIYPEWQERLLPEINQSDDLDDLVLCEKFINETMRLYPPVWLLEREALEEDTIGGYAIPKGSTVLMSPLLTHRHKDFWLEPETFDPEHFAPEHFEKSQDAFIPFGHGPHTCIGKGFARVESLIILRSIVKRFRIALHDEKFEPEFQVGITLRMKKPLHITVKERVD